MGLKVDIAGSTVLQEAYSISESATPLAGGDSSGAIGTISLKSAHMPRSGGIGSIHLDKQLDVIDTARGITSGQVNRLVRLNESGLWDVSADSRLGAFMIDVQVSPFTGTLGNAFKGYAGYANITSNITIDAALTNIPVSFPGFSGNLWQRMKEMAVGYGAEINLVSGVVVLRKVRQFLAITDRESASNVTYDATQKAHQQEVIWYKTARYSTGLIYPPGGWVPETRVLSVNAGEDAEHILETDSSITSIQAPTMLTSVAPGYSASSVYTIVGDDNLPIQPAQWRDYGGTLSVSIEPDTRRLRVKMRGASGLVKIDGTPMRNFRVALTAGTNDSTYSTLRIVGDSVRLEQRSIIIPTGIPYPTNLDGSIATERIVNAPTIDSEFINTMDAACSAGVRGAGRYSGKMATLSATVSALNRRGKAGTAVYPTWQFAQDYFTPGTYAQFNAANASRNYVQLRDYLRSLVDVGIDNQLFGNAPGARFWDRRSRLWFRIRDATTAWDSTAISADIDTTWGDYKVSAGARTYGQIKATYPAGATYRDVAIGGLPA